MSLRAHYTLGYLLRKSKDVNAVVPLEKLPKWYLGFTKKTRVRVVEQLLLNKEITIYTTLSLSPVNITLDGKLSYVKKKYVNLFWKNTGDKSLRFVQIFTPIGLLVCTVISLLILLAKEQKQQTEITKLNIRIDKLDSLSTTNPSSHKGDSLTISPK